MPVLSPKSGMAYLAGLVAADGHLESNEPYIVIPSKEYGFLKDYVVPLIHDHTGISPRVYWDKSAKVWKVRIYSRSLWNVLIHDYAIPAGSKASHILPPAKLEINERVWYIRGWFDGEGWLESMTVRRPYGIYQYPRIGFKVKNRPIRDWILAELTIHGVRSRGYDRRDGSYGIWINGTIACQTFLDTIGFLYPPRNSQLKRLIRTHRGRISPNQAGVR